MPPKNLLANDIFPTRRATLHAVLIGVPFFAFMVHACIQATGAYLAGGGFDLPADAYVQASLFMFVQLYVTTYGLRRQARQLALWISLRRRVVIYEWDPPCSPAAAGALLDGDFGRPELAAQLIDLHYRGYLDVERRDGAVSFSLKDVLFDDLQYVDAVLMRAIFATTETVTFPDDPLLPEAQQYLRVAVYQEALAKGLIHEPSPFDRALAGLYKLALPAAYVITGIMVINILTIPLERIMSVGYPRYPMYLWQLLFDFAILAIPVVVLGGIFIRTLLTTRGQKRQDDVAGLYLYLRTVFQNPDRYMSKSDIKKYLPYAVAFRLVNATTEAPVADDWRSVLTEPTAR